MTGRPLPPPPAPQAADTPHLIGAHYFPGWKPDAHWGWGKIEPFPERKPLLGWYEEGDPTVADWEIKWALEHGIRFFLYCWYRDRERMNRPMTDEGHRLGHALHEGLFRARSGGQMRFAIMWETHNAGVAEGEADLLDNLLPYWIDTYFRRPNYLVLNGRPLLFVYCFYSLDSLCAPFAGRDNMPRVFDRMRERTACAGFDGLTVLLEYRGARAEDLHAIRRLGVDWAFAYCWHTPKQFPAADEAIRCQLDSLRAWREAAALPFLPTASMGWDPMPWRNDNPNTPWLHADKMPRWKLRPADWRRLLREVRDFMDELPPDHPGRSMLLDNWNEWGEGHYIAPQATDGFGYLDAVRDVFCTGPARHEDQAPPCA
jgi:hypothetical protein